VLPRRLHAVQLRSSEGLNSIETHGLCHKLRVLCQPLIWTVDISIRSYKMREVCRELTHGLCHKLREIPQYFR
jgi:hypothetical protein